MSSSDRNDSQITDAARLPESMIGRMTVVLNCFSDGTPALTLTGICTRTGMPKSTASRITSDLVEYGYLERNGTSISLGIRVFELGQQAARPRALKRLAIPCMADLRRVTGNTVHLAVLEETTVVYIEILHSQSSPRLPSRVGRRLPAFATGVGKALLAFSSAHVIDQAIERGLWKLGPNTITDPVRLREALAEVQEIGAATEIEESSAGISCVAAPIMSSASGGPIAAISVSGWSGQLDIPHTIPIILGVAGALSKEVRRLPEFTSPR